MPTSNVSIKGQITLPAGMRRKLGIKPKGRVLIESTADTIVIRPAPDIFDLEGFAGKSLAPGREREWMEKAVAEHVTEGQGKRR